MAGRFAKHNGATLVIEREAQKTQPTELRRFKPDFYDPIRKPIKSPNFLQNRANGTFGKRVVDAAAKQVARRAPLALAGPLGDLLALGLITWDMYLLLLELQNNANPVPPVGDPPDPNDDPTGPIPYDLNNPGWYTGQAPPPALPPGWVTTGGEFKFYWNNPRLDYPMLGTSIGPPGNTLSQAQLVSDPGPIDSISTLEPVHHIASNTDWYRIIHTDWWIDLGSDAGTTYIGHGVPLPMDLPMDWAEPDPNMKRHFFPDGHNNTSEMDRAPETDPSFKRGPRFKPPRPTRPARNVRERKMKGPLNTILGIMDIISETSELVGAFYDALPKDVKHRWNENSRGLIDNAGQYGVDGADWKLRALWHNWHKVDIEQAIKNLIANEFQDKILGQYQRSLPKNIGYAADAGSLGLNDLINLFNETIGLS